MITTSEDSVVNKSWVMWRWEDPKSTVWH